MTPIAPHITAFFRERLKEQRGASEHTNDSYACAFYLLFNYASEQLKVSPSNLGIEQIDAPLVEKFLQYLEEHRNNCPSTRNVRLAAIKSFFRFLEYREPPAIDQIRVAFWQSPSRRLSPDWSIISIRKKCKRSLTRQIPALAWEYAIEQCSTLPCVLD